MEHDDIQSPVLGRRQILRTASALGIFALARTTFARSAFASEIATPDVDFSDVLDDARFQSVCSITPSSIQGPYYLNLNLLRTDITEGLPGLATRLLFQVV